MRYLLITFNLALSFVLLVAQMDDSLSDWDSFWNELPEKFDEETISLSKPIQIQDQEGYSSGKMDPSANELYSDVHRNLDGISTASESLDSSSIDLFGIANDQQPDECSSLLSSPPSRVRPRGQGGVCPNPDDSASDELTLEEQVERLWCSETAVPGFQNIPVCKSDGRETMDELALSDPSELPLYEPTIALPGTVTLKECYLSMSIIIIRLHINFNELNCSDAARRVFL